MHSRQMERHSGKVCEKGGGSPAPSWSTALQEPPVSSLKLHGLSFWTVMGISLDRHCRLNHGPLVIHFISNPSFLPKLREGGSEKSQHYNHSQVYPVTGTPPYEAASPANCQIISIQKDADHFGYFKDFRNCGPGNWEEDQIHISESRKGIQGSLHKHEV